VIFALFCFCKALETIHIEGSNLTGSMPNGVCPDMDDCSLIECSCCLCVEDLIEGPSIFPIKKDEFTFTEKPSQEESSESTVGAGTLAALSGAVSIYPRWIVEVSTIPINAYAIAFRLF